VKDRTVYENASPIKVPPQYQPRRCWLQARTTSAFRRKRPSRSSRFQGANKTVDAHIYPAEDMIREEGKPDRCHQTNHRMVRRYLKAKLVPEKTHETSLRTRTPPLPSLRSRRQRRRLRRLVALVVAGDSRNCGDVVMPAIAEAAKNNNAKFYCTSRLARHLHLRRRHGAGQRSRCTPLNISNYLNGAFKDAIDNPNSAVRRSRLTVSSG